MFPRRNILKGSSFNDSVIEHTQGVVFANSKRQQQLEYARSVTRMITTVESFSKKNELCICVFKLNHCVNRLKAQRSENCKLFMKLSVV